MKFLSPSATGAAFKILILKPSSLGDIILALPVLRLLKRQLPESEIYWWIDSNLAGLLEGDVDLAGLFRFERRKWARLANWGGLARSIRSMRARKFDLVIDLQGLIRSGLFAWLANGGCTVGLSDAREGSTAFYDRLVRKPPAAHAVDCYLEVLPALGLKADWNFTWLPERKNISADLRARWNIGEGPLILLQPGARWENKRWPAEHFAQLIRLVSAARPQCRFAIMGSAEDQPLAETLAAAAPQLCLNLAGKLSLPEMIEAIRLGSLMVTGDTGPMHVAVALGKPVVALFGPTDPGWTGPYGQLENVLRIALPCVPCEKSHCNYVKPFECLRALPPERVCQAVLARLG